MRLDGAALEEQGRRARPAASAPAGCAGGDVVAWQAPNWHEAVLLYRACWRLGAIAAPIHHQAGAGRRRADARARSTPRCGSRPTTCAARAHASGSCSKRRTPVHPVGGAPSDLAVVVVHVRVDRRAEGGAPHPARPRVQGARHGRRPRAHAGRRDPHARAARARLRPAQRGARPRRAPDAGRAHGAVGARGRARHDRARAHHVHDRAADVLRRAHGGARVRSGAGREPAPRLERRRRRDPRVRRPSERRIGAAVKRTYGSTEAPTVTTSTAARPGRSRACDRRPRHRRGQVARERSCDGRVR